MGEHIFALITIDCKKIIIIFGLKIVEKSCEKIWKFRKKLLSLYQEIKLITTSMAESGA